MKKTDSKNENEYSMFNTLKKGILFKTRPIEEDYHSKEYEIK